MIKFMLNTRKPNNYAFFCPISRLHLTVSSPVGFSNEVTPAILKALKAETVLDVDGVVDIEMGTVKAGKQEPKQQAPANAPEPTAPAQNNEDNGDSKQDETANAVETADADADNTAADETTAETDDAAETEDSADDTAKADDEAEKSSDKNKEDAKAEETKKGKGRKAAKAE